MLRRVHIPPMRETALGEIMQEPPVRPATPLAPAPESRKVEVPSFQCPDCGKTFKSAQGLGAHRGRTHGYRKNGKAKSYTPTESVVTIDALIADIFPEGIPANREALTKVLEFVTAYDNLVEMTQAEG